MIWIRSLLVFALLAAGCKKSEESGSGSTSSSPSSNQSPPPREAMSEISLKLPEYYGLYLVEQDRTTPFPKDGHPLQCGRSPEFLLFDKSVNMSAGEWAIGGAKVDPEKLRVETIGIIDCRTKPVKGQPEMVRIVPSKSLDPGIYVLARKGDEKSERNKFHVDADQAAKAFAEGARKALAEKNWDKGIDLAEVASLLLPEESAYRALRDEARQKARGGKFADAADRAKKAFEAKRWVEADRWGRAALSEKFDADLSALVNRIPFEQRMEQAMNFFLIRQADPAMKALGEARRLEPKDAEAIKLREEILKAMREDPLYFGESFRRVRRLGHQHESGFSALAWKPDASMHASAGKDSRAIIWDMKKGEARWELRCPRKVTWVSWSSDGKSLAAGSESGAIQVVEPGEGAKPRTLQGHDKEVWCVAFHPKKQWLASAGSDKTVRLWDAGTGTEIKKLTGHDGPVYSVLFTPDGSLISAGDDKTIRIWNPETGSPAGLLTGHEWDVWRMTLSPDGKILASGDSSGLIRLWDVKEKKMIRELKGPWCRDREAVLALSFTPDGKALAVAHKSDWNHDTIRFWSVEGEILGGYRESGYTCATLAFAPSGRLLALDGSSESDLDLWGIPEK